MSVNLTHVLDEILTEKELNMKPEDIRYGKTMMGVKGTLRPFTIDGSDTTTLIHTGTDTPIYYEGIWLNTDKTFENIYIENERYTNECSWMYSDDTSEPEETAMNAIKDVVAPVSMEGCTYVQKGNVMHFFGYHSSTTSKNTTELIHQHYMYDFDTNVWTKLVNCPTPQGFGGAVWIGDYIYIFGSYHVNYWNYAYKYDTVNDTWERMGDITRSADTSTTDTHAVQAVLVEDKDIYYVEAKTLFKYDLDTQSSIKIINTNSHSTSYNYEYTWRRSVYGTLFYRDNQIIQCTSYNNVILAYNLSTGKYTSLGNAGSSSAKVLWYDSNNLYACENVTVSSSDPVYVYKFDTNKATAYSKSNNSFANNTYYSYYPLYTFDTKPYKIVGCIGNTTRTTGMTLNRKTYDFDKNTAIIYSTTNSSGKYRAQLFQNSTVLNNGRILTRFDDIDLFEKGETENTLHQDINTYYGDGTQWIEIK